MYLINSFQISCSRNLKGYHIILRFHAVKWVKSFIFPWIISRNYVLFSLMYHNTLSYWTAHIFVSCSAIQDMISLSKKRICQCNKHDSCLLDLWAAKIISCSDSLFMKRLFVNWLLCFMMSLIKHIHNRRFIFDVKCKHRTKMNISLLIRKLLSHVM